MAVGDITSSNNIAPDPIAGAIRSAAAATGVDFSFLFQQAKVESGLDANAKAGTSSATGLFQFTRDTWFKVVEQHGSDMGLAGEASALKSGTVSAADKQRILEMRSNPEISARLAAHYAIDNAKALQAQGHKVTGPTDLYLAHFLGSAGAAKFLAGMKENPNAPAASVLPSAAGANKTIFYKDGAPASFADIYQRFAKRFDSSVPASRKSVQMASLALNESVSPERATTVGALVARLKAPEALAQATQKPAEQLAASGSILQKQVVAPSPRAPLTQKAPSMPALPARPGQSAPAPLASTVPPAATGEDATPINVDSLAKFLDSASKWSADPDKMEQEAKKGVATRDASEGIKASAS